MTTCHLGIDVAKSKLDCALRLPNGKFCAKVVTHDAHGHSDLVEWRAPTAVMAVHVGMDAPGVSWEDSAQCLATHGITGSVVTPAQIQAYAASRLTRTNTEAVDARRIAAFCAERHPPPWQARGDAEVALRALVLRLAALPTRRLQESTRWAVARAPVRPNMQEHLDWLEQQLETLPVTINQHLDSNPNLQGKREVLDRIPGRGERTIAILLAFCADPSRLANRRQAAAVGGLDPRQHESGTRVKTTPRLSKIGHAFLRKALSMPAMVTLYKTAWGKQFKERLARSGKPPKLIIGAMMRKLLHVAFGVLKSGKKFDPALHDA